MLKKLWANFALRRLVFGCLIILFSVIFLESCVLIDEGQKDILSVSGRNTVFCVVPGVILLSGFLLFAFRRIERIKPNNIKRVMWGIGALILFIQFLMLFLLIRDGFKGITDTCRVISQALAMVQTQDGLINNDILYFGRYANNYPFTVILYYLFKGMDFFGLTCYTSVLMVINVLLIDISGVFAVKLMRMLKGDIWGVKLLVLFLLCPTTYVWIVFTYTNTFSMPFIMGTLYFGIKAMRKRRRRVRNIVIAAVLGAVGYQIRPSTIVPIIAVILGILFALRIRRFREKCVLIGIILVIFTGVMLLSSNICKTHLKNPDMDKTFPFTHWLMMGMNPKENGFVNRKDVEFTMSFPTKEEKMRQNIRQMKSRLVKMGPRGYAALLAKKLQMVWGLGTDGYQGYYVNGENISGVHKYLFGDKGGLARIYCQIFRCTIFLFALLSILFQLRKKGVEEFFIISLTALGVIAFFLLWETNKKYNICFMELFLILMGDGMTRVGEFVRHPESIFGKQAGRARVWLKRAVGVLIFLAPAGAAAYMAAGWQYYTQTPYEQRKLAIQNSIHKEEFYQMKHKGEHLEQTFVTGQAFNEIRVMQKFKKGVEADSYRFELLDSEGRLLTSQTFPQKEKSKKDWQVFDVPEVAPCDTGRQYTIRIVCEKEQKEGLQIALMIYSSYNVYSGGSLVLNTKPLKWDMTFSVSKKTEESRISEYGYTAAGIIFWLLSGLLSYLFMNSIAASIKPLNSGCG